MLESDKYDKPHKSSPSEIPMRKVIDPQLQIGEQDIGAIRLDPKSWDDIPQILLGLQHIVTIQPILPWPTRLGFMHLHEIRFFALKKQC
ncbi:MAG: hypothetical protein KZQ60_18360, partial [Candidatus Thiodiazotropha sp. (ex Lucinoma aequizonata)]|nr:hypothetical protein [Candidatus Thiodiazotropha sp. (ex Lucinoma aequizonata)]